MNNNKKNMRRKMRQWQEGDIIHNATKWIVKLNRLVNWDSVKSYYSSERLIKK